MASHSEIAPQIAAKTQIPDVSHANLSYAEAETVLQELASVFFESAVADLGPVRVSSEKARPAAETPLPNMEAKYRALVEQLPAVVFMASLDDGIGEAYVSPQIERVLGFTQEEWLQDPVRWYQQVHPEDKERWSVEAAQLFLTGEPLRSAYRVLARDGKVIWFHCEAKMIRRDDGQPVVYSWGRLRHYRPEADGRSIAGRAQCRFCDPGYGRDSGGCAGSFGANHPLQSRL